MGLFYQHKGLSPQAESALDQIPKGHLNIRYQRMFSGAFMYASGNHIGIQWPETAGLLGASPVQSDEAGRYVSGQYFGWGIAHEIGHNINQGEYEVVEITNNYFAQLAQAKDTNEGMRFDYEDVYEKVTSGTQGPSQNLATQLALYWQLHLAYDTGYNYKTYGSYEEQLANLFYARMDTYARDASRAPKAAEGGVALQLGDDKDQNLMRLACAAAEKNILPFFVRWGKVPDEATKSYAAQFGNEDRAIYYVSDDSRAFALEHPGGSTLNPDGTTVAVGDGTTAKVNGAEPNRVDFELVSQGIPKENILGYEIVRCTISGGKTVQETAGFATGSSFSDYVTTMNNRTVFYKVVLVDKYLNRSAEKTLEPLKIQHDGSQDKGGWTVQTSGLVSQNEVDPGSGSDEMPCEPKAEDPADYMIDTDMDTSYVATAEGTAEIVLDFHRTLTVSGLKYASGEKQPSGNYEIQVCQPDAGWVSVADGSFVQGDGETIYFNNADKAYVSTYEATAVKLSLKASAGQELSFAELDVLGVTGDNVEFVEVDGTPAIGRLAKDYVYGENEADVIPSGSIVFTGSYKGNPAYNVLVLYDADGNIVGGLDAEGNLMAQQIILADVPETGDITDVSDGRWIYWIEPSQQEGWQPPTRVRAELYRVNNALTNEGQRLVSDTLYTDMPERLPEIEFGAEE